MKHSSAVLNTIGKNSCKMKLNIGGNTGQHRSLKAYANLRPPIFSLCKAYLLSRSNHVFRRLLTCLFPTFPTIFLTNLGSVNCKGFVWTHIEVHMACLNPTCQADSAAVALLAVFLFSFPSLVTPIHDISSRKRQNCFQY